MLQNDTNIKLNKNLDSVNKQAVIAESAVRTTLLTSNDIENFGADGIIVTLDVTNVNTSSLVLTIDRKDIASGKYVNVLTSAAVTTVSTNVYKVAPGLVAAAGLVVVDYIGSEFRVVVTPANANNTTYSVGYCLV